MGLRDWWKRRPAANASSPSDPQVRSASIRSDQDEDDTVVLAEPASPTSFMVKTYTENGVEGLALNGGYLFRAVLSNEWAFLSATRPAAAAAQSRIVMTRNQPFPLAAELPSHPWLDRLNNPNDLDDAFVFHEQVYGHLRTYGNAFIALDRSGSEVPTLHVINPLRMIVIPDPVKRVAYYVQRHEDGETRWDPRDIIHIRAFNPVSDLLGMAFQVPLHLTIASDDLAGMYNLRFYRQGANISGVLEADDVLPETDYERLRKQFRERYAGVANAHAPVLLEGGVKWKQTGAPPKDVEFISAKKMARDAILGVSGIPPVIAGVLEHANYNNVEAQYAIFWNDTVTLDQTRVGSRYTYIVRRETQDASVYVGYDNSEVPALRENPKAKAAWIVSYVRFGVYTPNDARKILRKPPIAGGDQLLPLMLIEAKAAAGASDGTTPTSAAKIEETLLRRYGLSEDDLGGVELPDELDRLHQNLLRVADLLPATPNGHGPRVPGGETR